MSPKSAEVVHDGQSSWPSSGLPWPSARIPIGIGAWAGPLPPPSQLMFPPPTRACLSPLSGLCCCSSRALFGRPMRKGALYEHSMPRRKQRLHSTDPISRSHLVLMSWHLSQAARVGALSRALSILRGVQHTKRQGSLIRRAKDGCDRCTGLMPRARGSLIRRNVSQEHRIPRVTKTTKTTKPSYV